MYGMCILVYILQAKYKFDCNKKIFKMNRAFKINDKSVKSTQNSNLFIVFPFSIPDIHF